MASDQDADIPQCALDTAVQYSTWDHPTTTATLAPNTSMSLSAALPMDNDPFGSFSHSIPSIYSPSSYPEGPPRLTAVAHPPSIAGASPSTIPMSRSPLLYAMPPPVLPSSTTVFQPGAGSPVPVFGHMGDGSQFLPPRPAPFHQHINPPGIYGMSSSPGTLDGFLPESSTSGWGGSMPAAEPLYPAAAGSQSQQVSSLASNQHQRGSQPRRQPRHLTTKEEANFQCEVRSCGKLFSRSYNYKAHMETHDEKREYPFPCQVPDCDKKFVRKTDLQRHHQSVHMKERSHKCDYCGRLFARKDTLRRHMDDGCSRRFDIGTLDLGADGMGGSGSSSQDQPWRVQ